MIWVSHYHIHRRRMERHKRFVYMHDTKANKRTRGDLLDVGRALVGHDDDGLVVHAPVVLDGEARRVGVPAA